MQFRQYNLKVITEEHNSNFQPFILKKMSYGEFNHTVLITFIIIGANIRLCKVL